MEYHASRYPISSRVCKIGCKFMVETNYPMPALDSLDESTASGAFFISQQDGFSTLAQ